MPHWPQLCYAMCPVLFESNTASNEGLSLQVRFFQSPAASIQAFCYKAMLLYMFSKKYPTIPPKVSKGVSFRVRIYFV